jgi:short-subunit dehydrogenase
VADDKERLVSGDFFVGRRAVVTGAAAGIGRAVALQLAYRGAGVRLWDTDAEGLGQVADRCRGWGVPVHSAMVDVGDRAAVQRAADAGPVDLLFCVAGTIHTGAFQDSDLDDIEHVMRVNYWGTVNTAKALLPQLVASGRGHLVTVSSAFGLLAVPRYSAYCASKFAVRGFSEALRQELAMGRHPVRVSCAYPGGVRTQIVRRGRFAAGEDVEAISGQFDRRIARTTPSAAAAAILRGVQHGRPRILVGTDAQLVSALLRVTGEGYQRILPRIVQRTAGRRSGTPSTARGAVADGGNGGSVAPDRDLRR